MKYVVKFTVTMIVEHSTKYDYDQARFFFEEHNCNDNLIDQLSRESEAAGSICSSCYRSEAKLLREASAEDIQRYGPQHAPQESDAVTP